MKRKILTASLVAVMSLGSIAPTIASVSGADNIFLSEAYAAGKEIKLEDGKSVELLSEPSIKFLKPYRVEVSNLKFKIKGFKDGDRLYLKNYFPMINVGDDFKVNKDSKTVKALNDVLPEGLLVKESSKGYIIGEIDSSQHITFNEKIEEYESVDITLSDFVFEFPTFAYTSDDKTANDVDFMFKVSSDNKEYKDLSKVTVDKSDVLVRKTIKPYLGQNDPRRITDYDGSKYLISEITSFTNDKLLKRGDSFDIEYRVPDSANLQTEINKDFFDTLSVGSYYVYGLDNEKGITNRATVTSEETYDVSSLNLDIKFNKNRDEAKKETVYKFNITNNDLKLDNRLVNLRSKPLSFKVNKDDVELDVKNHLGKIKGSDLVTGKFIHKSGSDVNESNDLRLDTILLDNGYVDANGIWIANKNEKIVKISYVLEDGKIVKSERVSAKDALNVTAPKTNVPKGYEVNWVKK